jgi:purine-nucleoside phosphorylase
LTGGMINGSGRFPVEFIGAAQTALVTGSGLSPAGWPGRVLAEAEYAGLGGMAVPGVEGHPGRLILLDTGRGRILVFAGRTHIYEGEGWGGAGCAAAAAAELGCRRIVLAQAAGSLKRSIPPGFWMLPSGIVSLPWVVSGRGPATKPAISTGLRRLVAAAAAETGMEFAEGILYWTAGPLYETPAEARSAVLMGADAATMSPLPELVAAAEKGLEAACLSFITNFAPNVSRGATGHIKVLEAAQGGAEAVFRILPRLAEI